KNLFAAVDAALRLLHPFMPFLTEELWHQLPQPSGTKSIALGRFPEAETRWKNAEAMREVAQVQEVVTALRAIRAELRLDAKKKVAGEFSTTSPAMGVLIRANREATLAQQKVELEKLQKRLRDLEGGS